MSTREESAVRSHWDHSSCEGTVDCPPRCPRATDDRGVPFLVRPYRPADFESLVELYDSLDESAATMGLPPFTRPRIEAWLAELTSNGWNLIALLDDRTVGHVAVTPADDPDPEFVVFVDTDVQNRGIGGELLKQLIAYADDRDHEALSLDVSTDNRRAVTVYENVGFETIEESALNRTMRLPLDDPIADRVRRPPAERLE
ncbi:GNAT family N-acetyltransferase [Haloterrigena sp. SYSU A558-1]|uniref:GNAT family N-acetyltransferase n=1 Tax=Haloterrigena gelatinilytica TaxID=2741724 RepID=A0A8J8GP36_9EURY|nr:GNAT family N-acetyltransferase [Haloterrigena gelatinilytica]NUB90965.1 GNAT family N-acetyltransferase [Haloterrigena gelatinilytica]NUC73218.1 GNAT family N-acetyltransferase [Haloterrigena gelatinilytica]